MEKERNLGVTEARFALTLLSCSLVAVGYIAILRLAGPKDTVVDVAPDGMSVPRVATPLAPAPVDLEPQPRVVKIRNPDDNRGDRLPQLSNRTAAPTPPTNSELR
jgi:hypothetical protein